MNDENSTVRDNPGQQRYEIYFDGVRAGFAEYRDEAGRRTFTHTKVDPDFEGHGLGSALARGALDDARERDLKIVARCPFIAAYIQRHPEYAG